MKVNSSDFRVEYLKIKLRRSLSDLILLIKLYSFKYIYIYKRVDIYNALISTPSSRTHQWQYDFYDPSSSYVRYCLKVPGHPPTRSQMVQRTDLVNLESSKSHSPKKPLGLDTWRGHLEQLAVIKMYLVSIKVWSVRCKRPANSSLMGSCDLLRIGCKIECNVSARPPDWVMW